MNITIDWENRIINIPKLQLTLIQSTPTEIRELDIDTFRMALKALESSEEGMTFLDTHTHNTGVSVGGVTLAMVVEIINDYTITFEDGQYAVNLVGANSNIGDRVNVNQVSVRSSNSAGLIVTSGGSGSGATPTEIDTRLSATHGSGSWGSDAIENTVAKTFSMNHVNLGVFIAHSTVRIPFTTIIDGMPIAVSNPRIFRIIGPDGLDLSGFPSTMTTVLTGVYIFDFQVLTEGNYTAIIKAEWESKNIETSVFFGVQRVGVRITS